MASSPTSKLDGVDAYPFSGRRTCARASGPIFDAQPAQLASDVKRICRPVLTPINPFIFVQTSVVIVARFGSVRNAKHIALRTSQKLLHTLTPRAFGAHREKKVQAVGTAHCLHLLLQNGSLASHSV